MASRLTRVQPLMALANRHPDADLSLASLAGAAGLSEFHLQRLFLAAAGETAKQYTLRLRLDRAAAALLTGTDSILDIALANGFQSHETFSRAFRRRFAIAPSAYRKRGFRSPAVASEAAKHVSLVHGVGPCIKLFRTLETSTTTGAPMAYSIAIQELAAQPVLVVRRRVKQSDIAATLAEQLGRIFVYAQGAGAALAGQPYTRYIEWGPGLLTIEIGLPIAAHVPGEGDIRADTLPAGPAAHTTHSGGYENLSEAHAAVQVWIEEKGLTQGAPPWEVYVTDPAEYPDPADWKTDLFWPLKR